MCVCITYVTFKGSYHSHLVTKKTFKKNIFLYRNKIFIFILEMVKLFQLMTHLNKNNQNI